MTTDFGAVRTFNSVVGVVGRGRALSRETGGNRWRNRRSWGIGFRATWLHPDHVTKDGDQRAVLIRGGVSGGKSVGVTAPLGRPATEPAAQPTDPHPPRPCRRRRPPERAGSALTADSPLGES